MDNKQNQKISKALQYALNAALILLAMALCVLLGKEVFFLFKAVLTNSESKVYYIFLEKILMFFLYFEFIVLIVKYFQEDYHFPIRYFLYIGITALIRLIVVHHDNAIDTFWYTLAILILIVGYLVVTFATSNKEKL